MNQQKRDDNFEERLLTRLKAEVAERGAAEQAGVAGQATVTPPWRRRGPRFALGAGVAAASLAAVLVFSAGGDNTSKAFAVESQEGGGVAITVYSAEDSAGLEAALAEAGIRSQVNWLPAGMTCREPHFTASTVKTAMGGTIGGMTIGGPGEAITIGVMSAEQYRAQWQAFQQGEISSEEFHSATGSVNLDPAEFGSDQTVVLSGSRGPYDGDPEGGFEASIGIAHGPVEPCDPVEVPNGRTLEQMTRVIEAERAQR